MTEVAVAADTHDSEVHGAHATTTGLSHTKLGMWVFLGSECLLFGGLISTYLLYKNRPGTVEGLAGPDTKISELFDIPFTSVSAFVLLMSSVTMVLALSAIQRGEHERFRLWITATALLGSLFVGGQVYEFTTFYREGLGFTTNVSSSAFYTLTGFHGAHVSIGVVMLLSLYGLSIRGRLPTRRAESVEIVGLYWHFVDIVWILIFTIVYLIP